MVDSVDSFFFHHRSILSDVLMVTNFNLILIFPLVREGIFFFWFQVGGMILAWMCKLSSG